VIVTRIPARPAKKTPFVSNAEALRLAALSARLEANRDLLRQAAELAYLASFESGPKSRTLAKRHLKAAWIDIAHCVRELSTPDPRLPAAPAHVVRHRGAKVVALKSAAGKVGAP
jgi:hypothetical protein